ncbi:MAG: metal ABC transporter solute-binding protein, Zn/Mn family, partial [Verrucomicrobiota bacterium]
VGVVETVAEVNPTPRQLAALHRSIRAENVKALFVPPGAPGALERQIAKDAGIKLNHLDPLETGELAPESYESGMRNNARTLKEQLK